MITQLNTAILPFIQAIQLDNEQAFVDILQVPPSELDDFTGFPSVSYYYESTQSDYSTVSQNRRDYDFNFYIYGIWQDKPLAEQYVLMYRLVDALIDALDKSNDLGIDEIITRPVPGEIRRMATERGDALIARVGLRCSVDAITYNS